MRKAGDIIVYREKGNLLLGTILEEKGSKIVLLSEENKRCKIIPDKIDQHLNKTISLIDKDFKIAKEINNIRQEIEKISNSINLEELYELLHEENNGFTSKTLTEYYFSELNNEYHVAMYIALFNDFVYFKLKNDLYYPKPYKIVHEQLEEKERTKLNEEKKKAEKDIAINWLKNFLANENHEIEDLSIIPTEVLRFLKPIKKYIIFRDKYEKKKLALEIIEELKNELDLKILGNPIESMFNFFIRLKIFKENENLTLLKYRIPTTFKETAIEEAELIKEFTEKDIKNLDDLRKLFTFTIDDIDTKDIDDAISLETHEDEYIVGVHIADVSHFINAGSTLDTEALNHGMSVYLPLEKIAMFPKRLSEDIMSLVQGKIRPALSFILHFDKDFQMIKSKITFSVIEVDRKMTYNEVHDLINSESEASKPFLILYNIAKNLQLQREKQGAIDFKNHAVKVKLDENGLISLKSINNNFKSELIIKELMIISNNIAAKFCDTNNIPAIYFCQDPPDENIELNDEIRNSKHLLLNQLRKMKKAQMELTPRRHFALGLNAYTQITSPIRRYHDLIIHRQIKSFFLENKVNYNLQTIQVIAATAEKATKEIKTIEKETTRYWLLKYLKQEKRKTFKAYVIRKLTNCYLVEIQEVFIQTVLMTPVNLENDQLIDITIDQANPFLDNLSIRRAVR